MKIKVGINGMGRIGRMIVRSIVENNYANFEIKHINNRTNTETCSNLLKYDSIHGKFDAEVKFDQNGMIDIDELNNVIGELKGIDIKDTEFSVESFNEYNSIISEKKIKTNFN